MVNISDEDLERLRRAQFALSRQHIIVAMEEINAVLKSIAELMLERPYPVAQSTKLPKCPGCFIRTVSAEHIICSVCFVNQQKKLAEL
jgi:hypothetical protein